MDIIMRAVEPFAPSTQIAAIRADALKSFSGIPNPKAICLSGRNYETIRQE